MNEKKIDIRGKLEIYADIICSCPNRVSIIIIDGNCNYKRLKEAHDLGLIIMPLKGSSTREQIITSTEKGILLSYLINEARELIK